MADESRPERMRRETAERRAERDVARAAQQAYRDLIDLVRAQLAASHYDPAVLDDRLPAWRQTLADTILPSIEDTFGSGYRLVLGEAVHSDDPYMSKHLADVHNRLVRTADYVFDVVRADLDEGRRLGESVPDLAARVQATLDEAGAPDWRGRATTIARTETIGAYNAGHQAGVIAAAQQFGFDPADVTKRWLATDDTRTRDTHREADGTSVVGLGTPFTVGGAPLLFPGDPLGPPEEVINCRCTVLYEFPEEGADMTTTTAAAVEAADCHCDDPSWGTPQQRDDCGCGGGEAYDVQDTPVGLDMSPVPWHGVLAPEGVMSGDRRKFAPDALRWRDLPLPLSWQKAQGQGHDGAVVVGRIDGIERRDGLMHAWGVMDQHADADEAIRQMAGGFLRGVSVDVDDATMTMEYEDGSPYEDDLFDMLFGPGPDDPEGPPVEDLGEPVMVVTDGRIAGSTLCAIPAFQEAFVALGPDETTPAGVAASALVPFEYNPTQARVPQGHGEVSGRWVDMWDLPLDDGTIRDFGTVAGASVQPHLDVRPEGVWINPDRVQAVHAPIAAATLGRADLTPPEGRNPIWTTLGGGPASGKSSLIDPTKNGPRSDLRTNTALINSDLVKTGATLDEDGFDAPGLPEYQALTGAGDATAASFVHEESSYVANQMMREAFANGYDTLLDGTGDSSAAKLASKIAAARDKGYDVHGVYLTVPTEVAIARSDARYAAAVAKGGAPRYVPHDDIALTHRNVTSAFVDNADNFDHLELWDNSGPAGSAPTLVYTKEAGQDPIIHDEDLWQAFLDKPNQPTPVVDTGIAAPQGLEPGSGGAQAQPAGLLAPATATYTDGNGADTPEGGETMPSGRPAEDDVLDGEDISRMVTEIVMGVPKEQSEYAGRSDAAGAVWDRTEAEVRAVLAANPGAIIDVPHDIADTTKAADDETRSSGTPEQPPTQQTEG